LERWLSWSKAHDWKSCVPYKGTEGSNPSLSAKRNNPEKGCSFFISRSIKGEYSVYKKETVHPCAVSFFRIHLDMGGRNQIYLRVYKSGYAFSSPLRSRT
jgi:hypothetical protein